MNNMDDMDVEADEMDIEYGFRRRRTVEMPHHISIGTLSL
jgi:hypothetical protein